MRFFLFSFFIFFFSPLSSVEEGGLQLLGTPLYWKVQVDGTEPIYPFVTGKKKKEEVEHFDWSFGYRLGVRALFPILRWELIGTYTHFDTQDYKSIKRDVFFTQGALCDHQIDYKNIDLGLYRPLFFSRFLALGTSFGVKKTSIVQEKKMIYQGVIEKKIQDRLLLVSMGPMIGVNVRIPFFSGVSLVSSAKGSLLFGDFEVKQRVEKTVCTRHSSLFTPTLQFFLGAEWKVTIQWMQLNALLGYEAEYLWRQNHALKIRSGVSGPAHCRSIYSAEDLTFYGGTGVIGIQF